jgi:hypothetical protein
VPENLVAMVALAANVIAHVLDHAEHRHVNFLEHRDSALDVEQRDLLRRRHNHAAVKRHALGDRELRVTRAGRQVEHQAIQLAPLDVEQKFRFELGDHRPAPDDRGLVVDKQRHRYVADSIPLQWDDAALGRERHRLLDPDHHRHAWPVYVGVHQADAPSQRMHREREVHRDGRFADSALAAGYRDNVLHARDCPRLRYHGRGPRRALRSLLNLHVDGRHARHRRDRRLHLGRDFLDDFGFGRRHRDRDGHACVRDFDILDDSERHDVAGEARVFYFLEFGENFVWTRHCADRTCRWFRLRCGHAIKAWRSCYHSGTPGKTTGRTHREFYKK